MYVKNIGNIKNYSILFLLIFTPLFQNYTYAQNTIYTPEGYPVSTWTHAEFTQPEIEAYNSEAQTLWIAPYQLNAVRIENATPTYRCHSYAWYLSEGGLPVCDLATDAFWNDGVMSNDGLPSYVPAGAVSGPEGSATHTIDEYHSARKIQNSYPRAVESGRDYVSKWGWYGLYQHAKNHEPYYHTENGAHNFKNLKTTHYGTIGDYYPKTWVGAGGITHTITGTVTVPAGITLTIKPGATVNFNSGTSLVVNGTLNATNVTFTSSSGSWSGIQFNSGSSGNIDGCTIQNVSSGGGSAIAIANSSPTIQNCNINNLQGSTCGIGVWSWGGNTPYLYNNNIQSTSHGIFLYESHASINSNTITAPPPQSAVAAFYHLHSIFLSTQ